MSEIKVGEYVRTRYGEIGIITENYPRLKCKKRKNATIIEYNGITKHSKDIIDLIEVGDFINGEPVIEKKDNELFIGIPYVGEDNFYITINRQEDIKSIVTKEQFKEMEYRV